MYSLEEIEKMNNKKRCKYCFALITKKDNLKTICNLCKQEIKEKRRNIY